MVGSTPVLDTDPLSPALLPARSWVSRISMDAPSGRQSRPFGLTRLRVVPEDQRVHVTGFHYDPVRQISVTTAGEPLVHSPLAATTTTSSTTKADNQTWTDRDPDD